MANSGLAKTLEKIRNLLVGATNGGNYTLVDERCKIGWASKDPDTDDPLYNDVKENGPIALVWLPTGNKSTQTKHGPFSIPIALFFYKAKGSNWTGVDILDLVDDILNILQDSTSYSDGSFAPQEVLIVGWDYETTLTGGLLRLDMSFQFLDPSGKSNPKDPFNIGLKP